jgi:hypothetical protein
MITNLKESPQKSAAGGNPLIRHLQESCKAADRCRADCLILTHDDPALVRRFAPVMQKQRALHLPLPQEAWSFGESDLAGAVSWSLREAGVREIYLCGHSQAYASPVNEGESMLSRLLNNQQRLQHAKHQFAQQVAELLTLADVAQAIQKGSLRVLPLFFLSQAGAFMTYNSASEEFHPLVPDEARM